MSSGCPPASGRDPLEDLATPRRILPERLRVVGRDVAGDHRVDVDALARPLVRERLRQLGDAALARGIARHRDPTLEREQRGDEDDLPGPALQHPLADLSGEHELGGEVGRDHRVPRLVGVLGRGLPHDRSGVVHEDVDPLDIVVEPSHEVEHGGAIGEVARVAAKASAARFDLARHFLTVGPERRADADDIGAGLGCADRDRAADPPPAPRDEHGRALETGTHARQSTRIFIASEPSRSRSKTPRERLERLDGGDEAVERQRVRGEERDRGVVVLRLVDARPDQRQLLPEEIEEPHGLCVRIDRDDDDAASQTQPSWVIASAAAGAPETSKTTSAPAPPLASATLVRRSSAIGSTTSSPRSAARRSRNGFGSLRRTRAPSWRATRATSSPIGPPPSTTATSSGLEPGASHVVAGDGERLREGAVK